MFKLLLITLLAIFQGSYIQVIPEAGLVEKHILYAQELPSMLCEGSTLSEATPLGHWKERIAAKQELMDKDTYHLLMAQCEAYHNGTLPKIADAPIKAIPIEDIGDKLVDLRTIKNDRIVMLPDPEKPFASPGHNSGFAAASKVRKGLYTHLKRLVATLDVLAPDFGYAAGQIQVAVFEGLRSIKTQEELFTHKMVEIAAANLMMTPEELFTETTRWVSPVKNNIPVHATGGAIDIRLRDRETGQFLAMGPFGVVWGANNIAPTYSADLTEEQGNNRLYLQTAATQAGLTNYPWEWWHFSFGDRYASFWRDDEPQQKALYGSADEHDVEEV